ncbi:hypothetical protein ABTE87_20045, partial [Acinetobacter baumannii]
RLWRDSVDAFYLHTPFSMLLNKPGTLLQKRLELADSMDAGYPDWRIRVSAVAWSRRWLSAFGQKRTFGRTLRV